MSNVVRDFSVLAFVACLLGCASVRQSDLDAWAGVPVIALDTHSLLLGYPMVKTFTENGIEIRSYSEKFGVSSCVGGALGSASGTTLTYGNFNAYQSCISSVRGCNGIFYIKNGVVIEAKVSGQCYTDESYRPQPGYERFLKK